MKRDTYDITLLHVPLELNKYVHQYPSLLQETGTVEAPMEWSVFVTLCDRTQQTARWQRLGSDTES